MKKKVPSFQETCWRVWYQTWRIAGRTGEPCNTWEEFWAKCRQSLERFLDEQRKEGLPKSVITRIAGEFWRETKQRKATRVVEEVFQGWEQPF